MTLIIENEAGCQVDEELLRALAQASLDACGIQEAVQVGLTLVTDAAIHEMNRTYRGVDRPTDVLSFPLLDFSEEYEELDADSWQEEADPDMDPESGELLLGDIVISLETAARQAEAYGHSFQREVGYLLVHGMMHLMGYDHETEEDKAIMREMEEEALERLGLTREE